MTSTLKDAINTAKAGNNAAPAAARPVSPDQIDDFFPTPQPQSSGSRQQTVAPNRPRRSYRLNLGFAPRQGESRFMKVVGALFLFAFAGFIWLLSESTTLAIPRLFTNALDVAPASYAAWVGLLAMSFLIVAHKPRFGLLTIKDLWWLAFTIIDTGTTFLALVDLATSKAALQHIPVTQFSLNWGIMVVACLVAAFVAVFAPISTMREALRLIRWEI